MTQFINPKLESFDISGEWKDENDSSWWAKDIDIHIENDTEEGRANKSKYGNSVGEVFGLCVCSPSYFKSPGQAFDDDYLKKALIMDEYDESKVETYLKEKINTIGEVTHEDFDTIFRSFFNMNDWDGEAEEG